VEELNTDIEPMLLDLEAVPPPMSHRKRYVVMKKTTEDNHQGGEYR
jgi:hypothetical protein